MHLVKVLVCICIALSSTLLVQGYDQSMSMGTKMVLKMFDECIKDDGFSYCLKKKFLTFMDRLNRIDNLSISDNIKIIKDTAVENDDSINQISRSFDESQSKSFSQKDQILSSLLLQKVSTYLNGRKIEIDFPKIESTDLSRSLEEGRGKMKKMMGMMMAGVGMKMAAMLPVAIAFLFVLSGKALLVAKVALVVAGIIALKKIMQNKHSGHSSGGWQSSGGGGWDRSIKFSPEAHRLAYNAYAPN